MTFPGGFRNKMVHGNFIYEIIDPYYPRKLMTIYEKDFSRHFTTPEIRNKKIDDILS